MAPARVRTAAATEALPAPALGREEPLITMADLAWIVGSFVAGLGTVLTVRWLRNRPGTAAEIESLPFTEDVVQTLSAKDLASLRTEYNDLYASSQVRPDRAGAVNAVAARVIANRPRYEAVGGPLGVPWYVVGAIHQLEGSGDFTKHLHNGDPLAARTVHVPVGRPLAGTPPFTWEVSARDALLRFKDWRDWSVAGTLYQLERYNGMGYRDRRVPSPYLWSYSNHYAKGKFSSDGVYDPELVSRQVGAATLLHHLQAIGAIEPIPVS